MTQKSKHNLVASCNNIQVIPNRAGMSNGGVETDLIFDNIHTKWLLF